MKFLLLVFLVTVAAVSAQQYSPPNNYGGPQYPAPPQLIRDNYVCTIQANYEVFGQNDKKHYRPTTNYCQDAFKHKSCDKCCKISARIQGTSIKEEAIIGFNMVLEKQPLCICCSPNTY